MAEEIKIINILTYQLPFKLANQIYNEYQSRLKESNYLIDNYKTYGELKENKKTVELFLALSIFYKRIITCLESATKFYGTVTKKSEAESLKIGSYILNSEERNKILAVIINYNQLLKTFSINPVVMQYQETRELLKSLINMK